MRGRLVLAAVPAVGAALGLGALIDRIDSDQIGADPHPQAAPERSDAGL